MKESAGLGISILKEVVKIVKEKKVSNSMLKTLLNKTSKDMPFVQLSKKLLQMNAQ